MFLLHQWIKNEPVDLIIGNTYCKYIARDEDLPYVRWGFPILDRQGHQYFPTVGYKGGLRLLEKILGVLHGSPGPGRPGAEVRTGDVIRDNGNDRNMGRMGAGRPCPITPILPYSHASRALAMPGSHAPTAKPAGQAHPGGGPPAGGPAPFGAPAAMPQALSPEAALAILATVGLTGDAMITGVELAGPGDPLATPEPHPGDPGPDRAESSRSAVSPGTLGLGGAALVEILAAHGLDSTLLVDAMDPEIWARLYAWIRPGNRTIAIDEAAQILLGEQDPDHRGRQRGGAVHRYPHHLIPRHQRRRR